MPVLHYQAAVPASWTGQRQGLTGGSACLAGWSGAWAGAFLRACRLRGSLVCSRLLHDYQGGQRIPLAQGAQGLARAQPLVDALHVEAVLAGQHPQLVPIPARSALISCGAAWQPGLQCAEIWGQYWQPALSTKALACRSVTQCAPTCSRPARPDA